MNDLADILQNGPAPGPKLGVYFLDVNDVRHEYETQEHADGMVYYVPVTPRAPQIPPHPVGGEPAPVLPQKEPPIRRRLVPPRMRPPGAPTIAQMRAIRARQQKPLLPPDFGIPGRNAPVRGDGGRRVSLCPDGKWRTVGECWCMLFVMNEMLPAADKMEDVELLDRMYSLFPMYRPGHWYHSKSFTNVHMIRTRYNQGIISCQKKTPPKIKSYRYVHSGDRVLVYTQRKRGLVAFLEKTDPPDAPPRSIRDRRCWNYAGIYAQYKLQAEQHKLHERAVARETKRRLLEKKIEESTSIDNLDLPPDFDPKDCRFDEE